MRLLKVSVCLLVVLTLTTAAFSQTATSSLRGTVMDPKGGVIPGATVTLKNAAQGFSRDAKTDDRGEYQFQQVPPATYDVTATAANVGTISRKIQLLVSTPATLDLTLKVTASTTVEVTASAPVVNTTDATIGNAFSNERIQSLPIQDRGAENLLSLQPGVAYTGPSDNQIDRNFDSRNGAVAGARSDQANLTVDGIDNNDINKGYAFQGAFRTPLDSVQEFRVTTSNSNADVGRSSGAQITLVTKSGTNNIHGSLFEYHRPTFGVANDWFLKHSQLAEGLPNVAPKLIRNTFGGSFGGPIVKDRMFIFFNYEGARQAETQIVNRVVPSDNLRQGIISYTCVDDPAHCPASGIETLNAAQIATMDTGCVGNGTCPWGGGPDPAVLSVLQGYPHPNNNFVTGTDQFNFEGFVFAAPIPTRLNSFVGKLDMNLSANGNHKLFIRGNLQDDRIQDPPQFPGQPPNDNRYDNSKGVAIGYTAILSNTLINNLRYGFVRQGIGTSGIGNQHHITLRGLDNPQGFTRTSLTSVPLHNILDDVTWTKGKHTIQAGGNWRIIFNNRLSDLANYFSASSNPSWLADSGIVGSGGDLDPNPFTNGFPFVDSSFANAYDFPMGALAGVVAQYDTVYNQNINGAVIPEGTKIPRHYKSNEYEFYAQDQWRIKPNLTITAGLRYSLLQPPFERNGEEAAPTFSMNSWFQDRQKAMFAGQTFNQPVTFAPSGKSNGKSPIWGWDYSNLAPRFALAYSPNIWHKLFGGEGKTSIRMGYGKYYDHFGEGIVNSFDQNGSFGLTTDITNAAGVQTVDCAQRYAGLFAVPTSPSTTDCTGQPVISGPPGAFPVTPPQGTNNGSFSIYWGLDNKLKTPYSHVFDASITRELPGGFVVETAYVGRLGRHLLQQLDLAMPLNITDPSSKMDYYTAMTILSKAFDKGTPSGSLPAVQYFENMFPAAIGVPNNFGCDATTPAVPTATQNIYDLLSCGLRGNETAVLQLLDYPGLIVPGDCFPACSTVGGNYGPFHYFNDQFSSLYAWSSIGTSTYHAGQLMLRHPMTHGVQFDFNYTYSKSMDVGSDAERNDLFTAINGGPQDNIIDSWHPKAERAVSTFDATHQINTNYVVEMPFGKRRHFAMNTVADAFLGGWDLSGVVRWTSGFPFAINNGANWATNWELSGYSPYKGAKPSTGVFIDACGNPTVFQIPGGCAGGNRDSSAVSDFINNTWRFSYAGEPGPRNSLRGPGYFGWDMGLAKSWRITEGKTLKFSWDVFNVFNNVRFDALSMQSSIDSSGSFGTFNETLSSPRKMQFGLRFDF
jgi:hypothetical protein